MSFDPVPRAVPSKLDRVFRAALFSLGLVAIVLIGCAYMYCPRSTHQNDQQEICLAIACLGGALALGAGLIGLVWTACSSYPRWGYAVIIVLLFSVGMVFVGF